VRRIVLHDTLSGRLRPLETREPGRVGIYACGPTVYARIHVGNARPYVVFSLLKRFLVHEGYDVTLVINVTDINDKIYAAARDNPLSSTELATAMTLASENIEPIIELIGELVESGHAYAAEGDVYFSVSSYSPYGQLSHRRVDELDQGEGVQGAQRKRDPADFALWKAYKPGEDSFWDSPWGPGRPGWHIECSAMAQQLLGLDFEIHGGGSDLIFPHHENEAAQTDAAHDSPLARLWVHNGMVRLDRAKMAKSEGNIFMLHEAIATYGRDALIAYFCGGHYHQPIDFDAELMVAAQRRVQRINEAARGLPPGPSAPWSGPLRERFFAALADDFNTPAALAVVFEWVREANRARGSAQSSETGNGDLREMLAVLGLDNLLDEASAQPPGAVVDLLERRENARRARDFEQADAVREQIQALGWEVRDGPSGPQLLPADE
jgi:cysteinyl-tRNA synthetase